MWNLPIALLGFATSCHSFPQLQRESTDTTIVNLTAKSPCPSAPPGAVPINIPPGNGIKTHFSGFYAPDPKPAHLCIDITSQSSSSMPGSNYHDQILRSTDVGLNDRVTWTQWFKARFLRIDGRVQYRPMLVGEEIEFKMVLTGAFNSRQKVDGVGFTCTVRMGGCVRDQQVNSHADGETSMVVDGGVDGDGWVDEHSNEETGHVEEVFR